MCINTLLLVIKCGALIVNALLIFSVYTIAGRNDKSTSDEGTPAASEGGCATTRNVTIVIAHPDDESMFFVPTIKKLVDDGDTVFILCLSTGNFDGLGETRSEELKKAARTLKMDPSKVFILDDPGLQDGMTTVWDKDKVSGEVRQFVDRHVIDTIITFDKFGVSGHINHICTYQGVHAFMQQRGGKNKHVRAFALESAPSWMKYVGPLSMFQVAFYDTKELRYATHLDVILNFRAMWFHYSQFVWYRFLHILFSRQSYVNVLVPIMVGEGGQRPNVH